MYKSGYDTCYRETGVGFCLGREERIVGKVLWDSKLMKLSRSDRKSLIYFNYITFLGMWDAKDRAKQSLSLDI